MKRAAPSAAPASTLPIDTIKVGKRFRVQMGDIPALAASIAEHGLLHPVVVTPERDLIAGERRLLAAKLLGWTDVPVTVVAPRDLLRAEAAENRDRADFTPSEAVEMAKRLRPIVATPVGRPAKSAQVAPISDRGRTSDKVAAAVGMSGRTLEKAEAVVAAVEADPELGPIADEMDESGNVDRAFQKLRKAQAEPEPAAVAARQQVMDADPRVQEAAARVRWAGVMRKLGELLTFPPEEYVALCDTGTRHSLEAEVAETRAWLDRIDAALRESSGLKVVGGSR